MFAQMKNEFVKFIKLKYGYIYVLLFVIINVSSVFNNNAIRTNIYSDEAEELLSFYYEKWGGTYDSRFDTEVGLYYANAISENYRLSTDTVIPDALKERLDEETASSMMKLFYASFNHAKNSSYTDQVSDVRGYQIILRSYESIDFFFVLIVLMIACVIFSVDKQKGQEEIVKATRYGNKSIISAKLFVTVLIVVCLEAVKLIFLIVPVTKSFPMTSLKTPLQNMAYMHNVTASLSIGEAFIFVVLCEITGLILTAFVCAFVIVSNAGSAEGFICGLAVAYVPLFLLKRDGMYRNVPMPSAYLAPYNFLESIGNYKIQYVITVLLVVLFIMLISRVYTYGFGIDKRRLH